MPIKLYFCGMSLDKQPTVTDALDAIKALRKELDGVKDELSSCKSYFVNEELQIMCK